MQASDGKWGYMGADGSMLLKPKYDQAAAFANGVAQVWVEEKLGYIDKTGKYIWEPK